MSRTVSLKTLERRAKMMEWLKADPSMNINQLMKRAAKEFGVKLSFALCKDVRQSFDAQLHSLDTLKRSSSALESARKALEANGNGHGTNGNGHAVTIQPTPAPTAITGTSGVSFVVNPSPASDTIPVWKVRAWQEVNAALAEMKG